MCTLANNGRPKLNFLLLLFTNGFLVCGHHLAPAAGSGVVHLFFVENLIERIWRAPGGVRPLLPYLPSCLYQPLQRPFCLPEPFDFNWITDFDFISFFFPLLLLLPSSCALFWRLVGSLGPAEEEEEDEGGRLS